MILRPGKTGATAAPKKNAAPAKPPVPLPSFYMLSHLEEEGPVRLDGVKLGSAR